MGQLLRTQWALAAAGKDPDKLDARTASTNKDNETKASAVGGTVYKTTSANRRAIPANGKTATISWGAQVTVLGRLSVTFWGTQDDPGDANALWVPIVGGTFQHDFAATGTVEDQNDTLFLSEGLRAYRFEEFSHSVNADISNLQARCSANFAA